MVVVGIEGVQAVAGAKGRWDNISTIGTRPPEPTRAAKQLFIQLTCQCRPWGGVKEMEIVEQRCRSIVPRLCQLVRTDVATVHSDGANAVPGHLSNPRHKRYKET